MWPKYLDLDKEACQKILRRLELEAYSSLVTALRAQGDLTKERRKVLSDLSNILNISVDRHKAEIRRAVNDELLTTVAYNVSGPDTESEWAREGRRIIPLLRRATPITAFTKPADKAKEAVEARNKNLLPPKDTKTHTHRQKPGGRGLASPPPDLAEMINSETGEVRHPRPPIQPLNKKSSQYGDVIILPSGMAVRFREEDAENTKTGSGRRKRKHSSSTSSSTIEVFPSGLPPVGSRGRRRSSTQPASSKVMAIPPNAVSQAGHGYARPFVPIPNEENFVQPGQPVGAQHAQKVVVVPGSSSPAPPVPRPPTQRMVQPPAAPIVRPVAPPRAPGIVRARPRMAMPPQQPQARLPSSSAIRAPLTTTSTASNGQQIRTPPIFASSSSSMAPQQQQQYQQARPTTIQLKEGASGSMKVIQAGARILPKPGTPGGAPVYMVSSAGGGHQNVMRISRSTPTKVLTLNASAVRPPIRTLGSTLVGSPIRTLQPRSGVATIRQATPNKPSVIVVQRGQQRQPTDINSSQRILHSKSSGGKPVMIVTTASSASAPEISTMSTPTQITVPQQQSKVIPTSTQQGNVIVLDLSQEQLTKNTVLSDILQATGILSEDSGDQTEVQTIESTEVSSTDDSENWVLVEQPQASTNHERQESQSSVTDIFSTALAAADINVQETQEYSNVVVQETTVTTEESTTVETTPDITMQTQKGATVVKATLPMCAPPHEVMPQQSGGETLEDISDFLNSTATVSAVEQENNVPTTNNCNSGAAEEDVST